MQSSLGYSRGGAFPFSCKLPNAEDIKRWALDVNIPNNPLVSLECWYCRCWSFLQHITDRKFTLQLIPVQHLNYCRKLYSKARVSSILHSWDFNPPFPTPPRSCFRKPHPFYADLALQHRTRQPYSSFKRCCNPGHHGIFSYRYCLVCNAIYCRCSV